MERLFKVLPPFAPDYSGVCSVLFELGGLAIIIDASGCTGNYTGYDEPRWYGSPGPVLCSGLREMDAVMGDEEKFFRKVREYLGANQPSFIALLGSPAPMVIGMDYNAVAAEISAKFSIPAFAFDTNGMRHYDHGASLAFLEIAKRFVAPPVQKIKNGINIIGATPLDLGVSENLDLLISRLELIGYNVVSCWAMNSNLKAISSAAEAELNLVISGTGLAAARYLERVYGIPFVTGMPIGTRAVKHFWDRLVPRWRGFAAETETWPESDNPSRALIVGEQVTANALRDCLRYDFGFRRVDVASYFMMDAELMEAEDRSLRTEADLTELTTTGQYNLIIGDPLYQPLAVPTAGGVYIDLPHYAVSSKVYRADCFLGEEGTRIIANVLRTNGLL